MILTTEQEVVLTVAPVTQLGNPASITGNPMWNSSNLSAITLVVAANGLSATAIAAASGSSTINVIANAGTVAAPLPISGSFVLSVTSAPAAALNISSGIPFLQ